MENTLENKAKFFAQYWGQNIMIWNEGTISMPPQKVGISYMTQYGVLNRKLELKPLSSITDEDGLELGKLLCWQCPELFNRDHIMEEHPYGDSLEQLELDFLRSKGYALPWMGLTVEELQEYGWIKLCES